MKIQIGDRCKDSVTGFEGIAICRTEYISGCSRVTLQPPVDKDGKIPEQGHFDEPMLELVTPRVVASKSTDRGGPQPTPSHHAAPVR